MQAIPVLSVIAFSLRIHSRPHLVCPVIPGLKSLERSRIYHTDNIGSKSFFYIGACLPAGVCGLYGIRNDSTYSGLLLWCSPLRYADCSNRMRGLYKIPADRES